MSYRISVGAWYPRTTLHLTEVYELLHAGYSELPLDKKKLHSHFQRLRLRHLTREVNEFEYIRAMTTDSIEIKYYEDGLYTIETVSDMIEDGVGKVEQYMNDIFNPALGYIFSLGAPTPKVLAHFPAQHPVVVSMTKHAWNTFNYDRERYGEIYGEIHSHGITVYKTLRYIFIVDDAEKKGETESLIEMQIFFREFKDQLKRYLNIHRTIWEEISSIKEKKAVSAGEVRVLRSRLDSYEKTVDLIKSRINQMSSYIVTRSKIARASNIDQYLDKLFQYKFEALEDTHTYIKEIWNMTSDYIASAIEIIVEIQNQSTQRSIQSLQLITLANVIATLLTKMALDKIPGMTGQGVFYVIAIIIAAWAVNTLVIMVFRNVKYALKFPSHTELK